MLYLFYVDDLKPQDVSWGFFVFGAASAAPAQDPGKSILAEAA
jgi:hypothetical protein